MRRELVAWIAIGLETHLLALEAEVVIDLHFEALAILLHLNFGKAAEVTVGVVAVAKGKGFNVLLLFEVNGSIIKKASNASTLNIERSVLLVFTINTPPCLPGLRTCR